MNKDLSIETKMIIYDQLFQEADELFKKFDPCYVIAEKCLRARFGGENFCCKECKYLSDSGCTIKALLCRLWLCPECTTHWNNILTKIMTGNLLMQSGRQTEMFNFMEKRTELWVKAQNTGLLVFRGSREDVEKALRNSDNKNTCVDFNYIPYFVINGRELNGR